MNGLLLLGILTATLAGCAPDLDVPPSRPPAASPAASTPAAASAMHAPSPTMASNAFGVARLALMEMTGSNCESSHEGQMALESIDFEGMAGRLGPEGGVLEDGRGWVGAIEEARRHFGATDFVAEDPGEHWFITYDPATLPLLFADRGPAAAALIEVPLDDGRTVWYLGPRWFVSIPC